jgi:hypothetical protein
MCPARLFKLTAMRVFIKQYADAEFDPATISILEDAFDVAWTRVRPSKAPYGREEYAPAGCAIIATYIISAHSSQRVSGLGPKPIAGPRLKILDAWSHMPEAHRRFPPP